MNKIVVQPRYPSRNESISSLTKILSFERLTTRLRCINERQVEGGNRHVTEEPYRMKFAMEI